MTRTTIECISNYMQAAEVDVTEAELREYCAANSSEDVNTTFESAMYQLLDVGDINFLSGSGTFELGGA